MGRRAAWDSPGWLDRSSLGCCRWIAGQGGCRMGRWGVGWGVSRYSFQQGQEIMDQVQAFLPV